jgi:diphthamide synthase (EF-2-diphthine--ammonia ligase)
MSQAVARAVREGFTHAAFGDLFLDDIRRYREERLAGTGLTPMFPLFDPSPGWTATLAHTIVSAGVRARVTCLNPARLDRSFAGREYDASLLRDLPADVDPCAERGEFHTCAYAGPMFNHAIEVETGITIERDGFVFTDLSLGVRPQSVQSAR